MPLNEVIYMKKWLNKQYKICARGTNGYISDSIFAYHGTEQLVEVLKGKGNKIITNIENRGHVSDVYMSSETDIGIRIQEIIPMTNVIIGIYWVWVQED